MPIRDSVTAVSNRLVWLRYGWTDGMTQVRFRDIIASKE
jgi:hypothetical protein